MTKTLLHFYLKTFVKTGSMRLCFLLVVLLVAVFIIAYTFLNNRVVAGTNPRESAQERHLRAHGDARAFQLHGIPREHPIHMMISSEVTTTTFLYLMYRGENWPVWQDVLEKEIERMRHISTALGQLEDIRLTEYNEVGNQFSVTDEPITEDVINMLPYRFVEEFGTTEGLLWNLWLAERLLEINVPPLSSEYEMSGFQFLNKSLTLLFPTLIPLLIFTLNSSIPFTSHIFLRIQPLSRKRIHFTGLCVSSFVVWIFFMFVLFLGFFASSLINGFGYVNYPISKTQTIADIILLRLFLMPVYITVCGFLEMMWRWLFERHLIV